MENNSRTIIIIIAGIVVLSLAFGAYKITKQNNQTADINQAAQTDTTESVSPDASTSNLAISPSETSTPTSQPGKQTATKSFTVIGRNFSFTPSIIKVKKGDTVTITFKDDDGIHDLVIDAFNAKTTHIHTGDSSQITFVANKIGQFEYYCSVGSHREQGMRGTLIVE